MNIIHNMMDIHSYNELKYIPRWVAPFLREPSEERPVIVTTRARQVGKSALLRNEPPSCNWRYVSMDDFEVLAQA